MIKYGLGTLDMLLQPSNALILALKAVRIGLLALGLFISTRVFVPIYEEQTFAQRKKPPGLWRFVLIWLGFDLALNAFVAVTLGLARALLGDDGLVSNAVLKAFAVDFAVTTVMMVVIGLLIGNVLSSQTYFRYDTEGSRAIRALQDIMLRAGSVVMWTPAFMLA